MSVIPMRGNTQIGRPTPADYVNGRKLNGLAPNEPLTEDRAALDFAQLYKDRLRYCHTSGSWFEWDGQLWRRDLTGAALLYARELSRELAGTETDRVRVNAGKTGFSVNVERASRSDRALAVTSDNWDVDQFLLGTPKGTVDLKTGLLNPSQPTDGITKAAAVAPAESADCPIWLNFLHAATGGDAGMVRFAQQWAGYSLTGDTREHALVFVYGDGGTGKSTFLNTVAGIIGDYHKNTPTRPSPKAKTTATPPILLRFTAHGSLPRQRPNKGGIGRKAGLRSLLAVMRSQLGLCTRTPLRLSLSSS